jgi:psp operon transcriptional activator
MISPKVPDILGESGPILDVKNRISLVAKVNRPVLLLGERGTGKELAAARLHYLSPRWREPYITLNCAALSQTLLDSELFGYETGAFTGAGKRRAGRFQAADGGTLFLDEISHLTLEAQAKILRVVEYGVFQLVGSPEEHKVNVRIVAATNANLPSMCLKGTFLPDLWDRLAFEVITLPPLRERPGDIPLLAHVFAAQMAQELQKDSHPLFSPQSLEALEAYDWPGNVRELKNIVERAVYRAEEHVIEDNILDIDSKFKNSTQPNISEFYDKPAPIENIALNFSQNSLSLPLKPGEFDGRLATEIHRLLQISLNEAHENQKKAAELLGISYHRFRSLNRKYNC